MKVLLIKTVCLCETKKAIYFLIGLKAYENALP